MPVQASTSRHTANTETATLPTTPPDTLHVSSLAERQAEASMTLDSLSRALQQGMVPVVEVMSLDGIYKVRIHHCHGISDLTRLDGKALWFKGTGEIRDLMRSRGISHGVLTWADQWGDEMIGMVSRSLTQEELLAWGTRICFR
ncbi:hypothetical protein [Cobetia sp. 5-25-4-2]|uniref:hypothetical protein n=1 Tax=Cobetia sp. 5-25-4-2 TaxID=2737459 RepID=UPI0021001698|nr:hypothetical protein [Cobetia sp. 5-25-4-2]